MSRTKGTIAVVAMQIIFVFSKLDKAIVGSKAILIRLIATFICKCNVMGIIVFISLCPVFHYHYTFIQKGLLRKHSLYSCNG